MFETSDQFHTKKQKHDQLLDLKMLGFLVLVCSWNIVIFQPSLSWLGFIDFALTEYYVCSKFCNLQANQS